MKILNITLHISFLLGILSSLYCKRYDIMTWHVLAWAWFWRSKKEEDRAERLDKYKVRAIDLKFRQLEYIVQLTKELSAAREELKELKEKEAK